MHSETMTNEQIRNFIVTRSTGSPWLMLRATIKWIAEPRQALRLGIATGIVSLAWGLDLISSGIELADSACAYGTYVMLRARQYYIGQFADAYISRHCQEPLAPPAEPAV